MGLAKHRVYLDHGRMVWVQVYKWFTITGGSLAEVEAELPNWHRSKDMPKMKVIEQEDYEKGVCDAELTL